MRSRIGASPGVMACCEISSEERPPLTRGLLSEAKLGERTVSPSVSPDGEPPPAGGPVAALAVHRTAIHYRDCASLTLIRGRLSAAAGLGIAKAFGNHQHCWWFSLTNQKEEALPPLFSIFLEDTAYL